MQPNRLIISLGSNIGNKAYHLTQGVASISNFFKILKISSIYETKPILFLDQENFYNLVLLGESYSSHPVQDFKLLTQIEKSFTIEKKIHKGPRILDIDLILWNNIVFKNSILEIPHYDFSNRDFVLVPLEEILNLNEIFTFNRLGKINKTIIKVIEPTEGKRC